MEVFPCNDLFSRALYYGTLEKGILASPIGTMAIVSGLVFMDLYKIPHPDMVYNADIAKAFMRGKHLVKMVLKDWTECPEHFKW